MLVPSDRSIKQDSLFPSFASAGSIAAERRFPFQIRNFFLSFSLSFLYPNSLLEIACFEYIACDIEHQRYFAFSKKLIFQFAFYSLFAKRFFFRRVCTVERVLVSRKMFKMWVVQIFFFFSFLFFLRSKRDRNNGKRYMDFSRRTRFRYAHTLNKLQARMKHVP